MGKLPTLFDLTISETYNIYSPSGYTNPKKAAFNRGKIKGTGCLAVSPFQYFIEVR
jgi:hypothetical protein